MGRFLITLSVLLLIVGRMCSGDDSKSGSKEYDDYGEEEGPEEEEEEEDGEEEGEEEVKPDATTGDLNYSYSYEDDYSTGGGGAKGAVENEMLSLPLSIQAKIGERVELPCSAKDAVEFVRIWMHGNIMLFTGSVKTSREERYSLKPGEESTLVIESATPNDSGNFTCRIMLVNEIRLTHHVEVEETFHVQTVPPGGVITVNSGDEAILKCSAFGSVSKPTFKWRREGLPFSGGVGYTTEGPEHRITNVTREDAGHYFCTAESENGDSGTASLLVKVLFAPLVGSLEKSTVRSGQGLKMELTCTILSEPEPKVSWYKENEVIKLDGRIHQEQAGSKYVLVFQRVSSDDVGRYMCYATNKLGSSQNTINVNSDDIVASLPNASVTKTFPAEPTEQLEIQLLKNQEALENFRREIFLELNAMRNITYSSLVSASSSTPIDISIFTDLERVQLELSRLQDNNERDVGQLMEFRRTVKDDLQRVWDSVGELQEVSNLTTKHLEELYDKDVLKLQNFQGVAESVLARLREDVATLQIGLGGGSVVGSDIASGSAAMTEKRIRDMENELNNLEKDFKAAQDSQKHFTTTIRTVFEDIDDLKKDRQDSNQQQLMTQRNIRRLEEHNLTDISSAVEGLQRRMEEFEHFKGRAEERLEKTSSYDEEKLSLVVKELQRLKNQIYYLQQSVLQLRQHQTPSETKEVGDKVTRSTAQTLTTVVGNNQLATISKEMSELRSEVTKLSRECVRQEALNEFAEKMMRESSLGNQLQDQIASVGEIAKTAQLGINDINGKIKEVGAKMEAMEADAMKYNVIIHGLAPVQTLERPLHLEQLVKDYFEQTLGVDKVNFDEAERFSDDEERPIRVRFPSVREKTRVLSRSRTNASGPTVSEEFTERVSRARKMLAAFARKRAKATKKKWALKNDQLFFNGRVFVVDEDKNRVVSQKGD